MSLFEHIFYSSNELKFDSIWQTAAYAHFSVKMMEIVQHHHSAIWIVFQNVTLRVHLKCILAHSVPNDQMEENDHRTPLLGHLNLIHAKRSCGHTKLASVVSDHKLSCSKLPK